MNQASIKLKPRFIAVPHDMAVDIVALAKMLQKKVASVENQITEKSFEGEDIPIIESRTFKRLTLAIKDLETLALCNIETVHGSKLPDSEVNPDDVL